MWDNWAHKISKFFLRLEDILNGEDRRCLLFDIETYPRRRWSAFTIEEWASDLKDTIEIDRASYQMLVDKMLEAHAEHGGTDDGTLLR